MEQEPLLPEAKLEQLKESLKASLAEVCDKDVTRLDTGQLVRIEEVLVVAHQAAKEAVSLRRRRGRRSRVREATVQTEDSLASRLGTHRMFTDAEGTEWDVFAVLPTSEGKSATRLPGSFQYGWLCFDAATEKRRLSPIPKGWEMVSDDELTHLRDQALPVPHRTPTPPHEQRETAE